MESIREQARIGLGNLTKEVQGREGRTLPLIGGTGCNKTSKRVTTFKFWHLQKQVVCFAASKVTEIWQIQAVKHKKTYQIYKTKLHFQKLQNILQSSMYTLLVWLSFCLYPMNVKTAKPIGSDFFVGLWWPQKFDSNKIWFLKI